MYSASIAGMILFGVYGGLMLLGLPLGWSEQTWTERLSYCFVTVALLSGFGYCWYAKNEALNRIPVVSSCTLIGDRYEMIGSTLRCKNGLEPRYIVVKKVPKIDTNEQTPCLLYGKIMLFHFDVSSVKTDEELETEGRIEYMNAPL